MYTKPLLSPNKENIAKILNPKLKTSNLNLNIQRNILDNSNYDNIKSHLPTTGLDLGGSKISSYNPISSQNKENIDHSTIPSKSSTNPSLDFNRLSISINPSTKETTTSIPLKSNYF